MDKLAASGRHVAAFSRQPQARQVKISPKTKPQVTWRSLSAPADRQPISHWICTAPLWTLPAHLSLLKDYGAQKIIALSSTSRFSKANSANRDERIVAQQLAKAEKELSNWCGQNHCHWVVLRPTMIYGYGKDRNIAEIAGFIKKFGVYPVFGKACGLRQPVHVDDVVAACLAVLESDTVTDQAYNLCGAETLTYREMLTRIFQAQGRKPRLVRLPLAGFRVALRLLKVLPRFRHWSAEMARRMNQDLRFDCGQARRDFGYDPRPFHPD